jgi:hypothetical protein
VAPTGWNLESFQVGAHKDDSGGDGGGQQADLNRHASVKPYAAGFNRPL